MKLWLKISQGLAALLLSAAALSLLLFAGALILGLAAAALIAAAGLFLAAPDEAKTGLKNVAAALEKHADRFAKSVNEMGQVVLACFGAQQAAPTRLTKAAPAKTCRRLTTHVIQPAQQRMIRPARMPLSESANICFNIDFADIPTSGRLIQFVFSGYFILLFAN